MTRALCCLVVWGTLLSGSGPAHSARVEVPEQVIAVSGTDSSRWQLCRDTRAPDIKARCARDLLAIGDRLYRAGAIDDARTAWHEATALSRDRALSDLLGLRLSLQTLGEPLQSAPPETTPMPSRRQAPQRDLAIEREGPSEGNPSVVVSAETNPRAGRQLGLGVGAGYDGLLSVVVSWMPLPFLSLEASVGVLFPAIDTRLRFFGPTGSVAPLMGLGVMTPLQDRPVTPLNPDLGLGALFDYGTAVHVDIGLSYAPLRELEISGGVTLMTTLSRETSPLIFFPYWFTQVSAYF